MKSSQSSSLLAFLLCLLFFTSVTLLRAVDFGAATHFPVGASPRSVAMNGSNIVGTVSGVIGTGATRDVTVNLTSGTGEFRLRVLD